MGQGTGNREQGTGKARVLKLLCFLFPVSCSLFPLACLLVCASGCRNNDLLENELRARDIQYREILDDLKKTEFINEALQRENDALRRGSKISPEQAAQTFGLKQIVLAMGTMGVDNGKYPGDSALQIVVQPKDGDDHIIKAPGSLQVIAQQISPEGVKSVLSNWDIGSDQLRRSWSQGLFRTGYVLVLPWSNWPQYENMRVTVRLTLADDRVFEADRDIKLRLPPPGLKLPGADADPPIIVVPQGETTTKRISFSSPIGTGWQPSPLTDAIRLGRPEPANPGDF